MPFWLESLDDKRPSKLKIDPAGFMLDRVDLDGFTVEGVPDIEKPYMVKVGDICFVALGQIVSRPYRAVSYVPSGIISITSPVENPKVTATIRARWQSPDPARHLRDSLLADYRTKPEFNGESL